MRIRRTLSLYFTLLAAGLKAKLNYRADTFVMVFASLLTQGVGYIFLWVVFQQMPVVAGWTLPEVVCVYAMIFVTEGFVIVLCEGLWGLSWIRHRGDFDAILLRPASPLLQVMMSSVGLNGFAAIAMGAAMIARVMPELAVDWTPLRVAGAGGLLLCAVLVRISTVLVSAAIGFWIESPFNPVLPIVHSFSNFARFPLSIYGRVLHLALVFVVPFAFVSYYPVAWVLGKTEFAWVGLFTPAVAAIGIALGVLLFRRGLQQYEGSGS